MTATATFTTVEQAHCIATLPELAGNGHNVETDGPTIVLSDDALDVLADLDEHDDGHYDGTHIWIGGAEYLVTH